MVETDLSPSEVLDLRPWCGQRGVEQVGSCLSAQETQRGCGGHTDIGDRLLEKEI